MNSNHKTVLAVFSACAMALLFGGAALLNEGKISADAYLWVQAAAAFFGFFALAGSIEKVISKALEDFEVSKLSWAVLLAVTGYLARKTALDDVNAVFHVDASALPMTLMADTVMVAFSWMFLPFIFVCAASALSLCLMFAGKYFTDKDDNAIMLMTGALVFSNFVTGGVGSVFIHSQLSSEARGMKIYRIAHATDFSSSFRCVGFDEKKHSVLFMGPDQRRVLVAPKIPEAGPIFQRQPEALLPLSVPSEFPVADCISSVDARTLLSAP